MILRCRYANFQEIFRIHKVLLKMPWFQEILCWDFMLYKRIGSVLPKDIFRNFWLLCLAYLWDGNSNPCSQLFHWIFSITLTKVIRGQQKGKSIHNIIGLLLQSMLYIKKIKLVEVCFGAEPLLKLFWYMFTSISYWTYIQVFRTSQVNIYLCTNIQGWRNLVFMNCNVWCQSYFILCNPWMYSVTAF